MTFHCATAADTKRLAARLAPRLRAGDIIGLVGDLGAGKTTFVQGLATGMGLGPEARVRSPTFAFAHVYVGGRLPLFHLDFYRTSDLESLEALGYEEYVFGDGVCAVEWADRVPGALGNDYLLVEIVESEGQEGRLIVVQPQGRRAEAIISEISVDS